MVFMWKDTMRIILDMLNINAKELSKYLDVNEATIPRLKTGETGEFKSRSIEDIYRRLFDLNNESSPVYTYVERSCLDELQRAIDKAGLKEIMADLWIESPEKYEKGHYKKFVMAMLRRTKSNHPVVFQEKDVHSDNTEASTEQNEMSTDELHITDEHLVSSETKELMRKLSNDPLRFMKSLNEDLRRPIPLDPKPKNKKHY